LKYPAKPLKLWQSLTGNERQFMSEPVSNVSASELLGGEPTQKKSRPAWPSDVPYKEHFPGAGYARHPIDKAFISLDAAVALGAQRPSASAPAPMPQPAPAPKPTPQPEPQPEPHNEPAPDFSDLPNGDGPGNEQHEETSDPEERMKSHRAMGTMLHNTISGVASGIFGPEWLSDEREESMIVTAWADALEYLEVRVLNPVERLAAAYGTYGFARCMTIIRWFKARKAARGAKRQTVEVHAEVKTEGAPAPDE
jgi:hypothetical protein